MNFKKFALSLVASGILIGSSLTCRQQEQTFPGAFEASLKDKDPQNKRYARKESCFKYQNVLYSELFGTLLSCELTGNYDSFFENLNNIKAPYSSATRLMSLRHGAHPPSNEMLALYLKDDKYGLLESSLCQGYYAESSVLCMEIGYPLDISKALYERGRLLGDEKIKAPYSPENILQLAYNLWISYLNISLGNSHRDSEGRLPFSMSSRLSDIIVNYPGNLEPIDVEFFIKCIQIDTGKSDIKHAFEECLRGKNMEFYMPRDFRGLENLVAGYRLANREDEAKEATLVYFGELFCKEIDDVYMGEIFSSAAYDKLKRFKQYLPEEKFNDLEMQLNAIGNK